jgi:hypothetical protein
MATRAVSVLSSVLDGATGAVTQRRIEIEFVDDHARTGGLTVQARGLWVIFSSASAHLRIADGAIQVRRAGRGATCGAHHRVKPLTCAAPRSSQQATSGALSVSQSISLRVASM